jgi:hypothetical protein
MGRSAHTDNALSGGIHTAQEIIDRDIKNFRDIAERLKAGIPGTVFYVPKRFHGNADLFCQVIAGDILFLSSSSDPLTHKNDVDFHIVHLYALSTVRLVYRNFVLK